MGKISSQEYTECVDHKIRRILLHYPGESGDARGSGGVVVWAETGMERAEMKRGFFRSLTMRLGNGILFRRSSPLSISS
jgi:hypothetical protein